MPRSTPKALLSSHSVCLRDPVTAIVLMLESKRAAMRENSRPVATTRPHRPSGKFIGGPPSRTATRRSKKAPPPSDESGSFPADFRGRLVGCTASNGLSIRQDGLWDPPFDRYRLVLCGAPRPNHIRAAILTGRKPALAEQTTQLASSSGTRDSAAA